MALTTQKRGNNRRNLRCLYCNKPGYIDTKCWIKHPDLQPKKDVKQTNTTTSNPDSEIVLTSLISHQEQLDIGDNLPLFQITKTPIQNQIQTEKHWILDSGGSTHVTSNPRAFIPGSTRPTKAIIAWGKSNRQPIKAT